MKGLKMKIMAFLLGCLTMTACVDYDDIQPFNGKTLPRKSGYSTGVTNDWIYFNLRTGEMFNAYGVNKAVRPHGLGLGFLWLRVENKQRYQWHRPWRCCRLGIW